MTDNPGELVEQAVERSLRLIGTWPAWDGQPRTSDDGRIYTPHKAVRRIADHLVDHLAEVEALLAGVATQPDEWHASALTSAADLAPFTAEDVQEAEQRLRRLGRTFVLRYAALDPAEWDKDPQPQLDPPRDRRTPDRAGLVRRAGRRLDLADLQHYSIASPPPVPRSAPRPTGH